MSAKSSAKPFVRLATHRVVAQYHDPRVRADVRAMMAEKREVTGSGRCACGNLHASKPNWFEILQTPDGIEATPICAACGSAETARKVQRRRR